MARGQLASIYRYLGQFPEAEESLDSIPRSEWSYIMYTEMGRLKAAQGQCEESELNFLQALQDRKEQTYSRSILDLAVLYALCFKDTEKSKHYFDRYYSFQLAPAERERVRSLANELGISIDE